MTAENGSGAPQVPASEPVATPLPPELRDVAGALKGGVAATSTSPNDKVSTAEAHMGGDAQEFACHIHSYLRQFIEFSDKKATFVFAIDAAVLIYFYQQGLQLRWLKPMATWLASDLFIFLAMALMFAGALACAYVVLPRMANSHRGFVFFSSIAEYESASDYSSTIFKQPRLGLTDALLKHDYDLAVVCKSKFAVLTWGMWLSVVGVVAAIIVLIFMV